MEVSPSKKIRQNFGDEDRLSSLPDCVLCYILSFLETKYVIQISVLSKRFQNIWSSLPSLNFHSGSFGRLLYFDKFVNRVLTLRDTPVRVESFKFRRSGSIQTRLLNKITNYAMSHGALRLYIEVQSTGSYSFPESGYSSESLRTFELKIHAVVKQPLSFPKLTKLHLEHVSLTHSDLLSTCPCLMELTLSRCFFPNLAILKIDSPTLIKLTIECCGPSECKVVISAAKLASFCYTAYDWKLLSISREPSDLEVINLEVVLWCQSLRKLKSFISLQKEKEYLSYLIKSLQPFHCAKYVTLSSDAIEVLSKFPYLLPKSSPFPNIKSLSIKSWVDIAQLSQRM